MGLHAIVGMAGRPVNDVCFLDFIRGSAISDKTSNPDKIGLQPCFRLFPELTDDNQYQLNKRRLRQYRLQPNFSKDTTVGLNSDRRA